MIEFIVLDIEPLGPVKGRYVLADITVAKASDISSNNTTYNLRTHLGGVLHPGDSAMGYFLVGTNFNDPNFEELETSTSGNLREKIPEVVLVKKHYPRRKKNNNKARNWKLRRMAKDEGELLPKKADQERMEREFEMFLRDVEEDTELRSTLQLYKSGESRVRRVTTKMEGVEEEQEENKAKEDDEKMDEDGGNDEEEDDEDDDDDDNSLPGIQVDELLDEFEDLKVHDD